MLRSSNLLLRSATMRSPFPTLKLVTYAVPQLSFPDNVRKFSTDIQRAAQAVTVGDETIQIPINLQLADVNIFKKPEPKLDPIAQSFPLLNAPEAIEVRPIDKDGKITTTSLDKTIFSIGIRPDIVHELVRYVRHQLRQPKRTKRIGDISGSNKKPRPQKKTGTSQVGNKRNSSYRKGQKAHGPVIRDYSIGMNKKQRALGMMMTIAAKFREGNLIIFDKLQVDTHKTKNVAEILKANGLDESKTVLVEYACFQSNFRKGAQNIAKVNLRTLLSFNAFDVLRHEKLVFSLKAFQAIQARLVYQYKNSGKSKSIRRNLDSYQKLVEAGKKILSK